ncbi:AraC family transcriptional regulator [Rhizobium miluonense]|uniref:AraC-type DNA-binding protein n=1 Tax=Rhizobium miluonense TaxID=411945 RepID=A0A1C3UA88_9HYPH|nr:AraC family transcriptional regulator [Rhizobium miluonense]SCB12406.1 AraC-type DNA-binding protein [Rhizobium miluonense]
MNIAVDKYAWSSCEPTELQEKLSAADISVVFDQGSENPRFHIDVTVAMIREMAAWKIFSETGYEIQYLFRPADRIELHFVESGTFEVETEEQEFTATAGTAFMLLSSGPTRLKASRSACKIALAIPRSLCLPLIHLENGDPEAFFRRFDAMADLTEKGVRTIHLMAALLLESGDHPFAGSPLGASLFQEALITAFLQSWPTSAQKTMIQAARPRNLKRALDWIQAHLGEEFTVLDIARNAGQSVRSLQLSFQQNVGMNPLNYVQRLRLQQIHHELLHGDADENISDIAARWGFSHMGYFAARYRALYGVSPSSTRASRRRLSPPSNI